MAAPYLPGIQYKTGTNELGGGGTDPNAPRTLLTNPAEQGTPSPYPTSRTVIEDGANTGLTGAQAFLDRPFTEPESEATIAERKRKAAQASIDAIEGIYADERNRITKRGDERLSEENALAIFSGLGGSPEASKKRGDVKAATDQEIAASNRKMALELASIYTKISDDARTEARDQLTDATSRAEGMVARDKERKATALADLTRLAGTGLVDYDAFKSNPQNKEAYDYALKSFNGSDDAVKGFFALNRPKDTVVSSKWEGSNFFQVYQNPITGKLTPEIVDFAAFGYNPPKGYTKSIDLGGQIMLVPENFDPTKDEPYYIPKSLTPNQAEDENKGFTFGNADKQKLFGANFSESDITNIEKDIAQYGAEKVIEGLTDAGQKKAIKDILGTEEQFLDEAYIKGLFGEEELVKQAKEAGNTKGGFLGMGKSGDVDAYLKSFMNMVAKYREAGYNDQEILKMMQ